MLLAPNEVLTARTLTKKENIVTVNCEVKASTKLIVASCTIVPTIPVNMRFFAEECGMDL